MFPIESVLKCIEVKTSFNKATIKDAFEKFYFMDKNVQITPGFHTIHDFPIAHMYVLPKFDFFAFNSDSNKYSSEYILNVYKDVDPNWNSDPLISSICIAGKGWICHTPQGWYHMSYDPKTKINEEVIGYLCTLLHDLDRTQESRGIPRIGY